MNKIINELLYWCAKHNIDTKGMKVTIEFPTRKQHYNSVDAVLRDVDMVFFDSLSHRTVTDFLTICGIPVDFKHED